MEYSDAENQLWWKRMCIEDQEALLDLVEEKASAPSLLEKIDNARNYMKAGAVPRNAVLSSLRKWAR